MYQPLKDQISYIDNLGEKGKIALNKYTHGYDSDINKTLRGLVPSRNVQSLISDIDQIFKHAPPLTNPIILYRGMNNRFKLTRETYQSTSLSSEVARGFIKYGGCCMFVITVSPGCKVLPLKNISRFSHEEEVLLNRDGIYLVTLRKEENGMKMVYVTLLPEGSEYIEEDPQVLKNLEEEQKIIDAGVLLDIIEHSKKAVEDEKELEGDLFEEEMSEDDIYAIIKHTYFSLKGEFPSENDRDMLMKLYYGL